MRVVLASSNLGKIDEILQALSAFAIEVIPQTKFHVTDIEETGLTFVENAILKARHACELTGLAAIADDSGIEVDALNGAPGVFSARYAGENATNTDRINKLLKALENTPTSKRQARFQSVMVFLKQPNDPSPIIAQGTWEGEVLFTPQGTQGFGYDPIFYLPDQQCSAAELEIALKNRISHRGQALQQLVAKLKLPLLKA